jgi:hypothetical protein
MDKKDFLELKIGQTLLFKNKVVRIRALSNFTQDDVSAPNYCVMFDNGKGKESTLHQWDEIRTQCKPFNGKGILDTALIMDALGNDQLLKYNEELGCFGITYVHAFLNEDNEIVAEHIPLGDLYKFEKTD